MRSFWGRLLGAFFPVRGGVPAHRVGGRVVVRFFAVLLALLLFYSVSFHYLMAYEGRVFSWMTGFYWTLTTMSTLGFGDIVFHSDLGRGFSILVLSTGVVILVVLMPFVLLRFAYIPFLEARRRAQFRGSVSGGLAGHLVLTSVDGLSCEVARVCLDWGLEVVILVPDFVTAERVSLEFEGRVCVLSGHLDEAELYRRAAVHRAGLVLVLNDDYLSATVGATVRSVSSGVCLVGHADAPDSVRVLSAAGFTHVLEFHKELALGLSERILGLTPLVVGRFGDFLIGEWRPGGCVSDLGGVVSFLPRGLSLLGVWERGVFEPWSSESEFLARRVEGQTVLLVAGLVDAMAELSGGCVGAGPPGRTLILGAGRVGRAVGELLQGYGLRSTLVERDGLGATGDLKPGVGLASGEGMEVLCGDAASLDVLERGGISSVGAVVVTTHEEDWNVYLAILCRSLRPEVFLLTRSVLARREPVFHAVGADVVMSYGFVCARRVLGWLCAGGILVVFPGVTVVRYRVRLALGGDANRFLRGFGGVAVAVWRAGAWEAFSGHFLLGEGVLLLGGVDFHSAMASSRWFVSEPFGGVLGGRG